MWTFVNLQASILVDMTKTNKSIKNGSANSKNNSTLNNGNCRYRELPFGESF